MAWDGPKWGQDVFFPTYPDLADILGKTDLNFENSYFFDLLDPKFLDSQVPRSQNSQIYRRRHQRQTNSQIPTRPLFQRTQGSNTSQLRPIAPPRLINSSGGIFWRSILAESQQPAYEKIKWRSESFDSARLEAISLNIGSLRMDRP